MNLYKIDTVVVRFTICTMKIIVAGLPKTGTKTVATALRLLGYNVYDLMEHYQYHRNEWINIYSNNATSLDFQQMYKDVDAVTDLPACGFWEDILRAFPDSKVRDYLVSTNNR